MCHEQLGADIMANLCYVTVPVEVMTAYKPYENSYWTSGTLQSAVETKLKKGRERKMCEKQKKKKAKAKKIT